MTADVRQQLDAEIEKQMRDNNLPSVEVSIVVPGEAPYTFVQGKANLETGRDRTPDEQIRIASNTKTFVGTAILQLVDQGKLATADTLDTWYPDFPNADTITVRDLLMMRSGIPDAFDKDLAQQYYDDPFIKFGAEDMIARSAAKASEFKEPDTESHYSNVNTILLERIIEEVSGNPIDVQITEGIVKPLGLANTIYPTDSTLPGEMRGYSWNADTKQFEDKTALNPTLAGGAGAMISNVSDLQTYVRALCTGKLLKPETQAARMQAITMSGSPEWVKYGENIGLFGKLCGHTGTIYRFSTDMFYLPDLNATVIISVNRLDLDDQSKSIPLTLALTKIAFPKYVNW